MSDPVCRVTVISRGLNEDLIREYRDESKGSVARCELFRDGQQFVIADISKPPEGFCEWAWADIRHDILIVASGGQMPGLKQANTIISGCTDWFRPVIFKIERMGQAGDRQDDSAP